MQDWLPCSFAFKFFYINSEESTLTENSVYQENLSASGASIRTLTKVSVKPVSYKFRCMSPNRRIYQELRRLYNDGKIGSLSAETLGIKTNMQIMSISPIEHSNNSKSGNFFFSMDIVQISKKKPTRSKIDELFAVLEQLDALLQDLFNALYIVDQVNGALAIALGTVNGVLNAFGGVIDAVDTAKSATKTLKELLKTRDKLSQLDARLVSSFVDFESALLETTEIAQQSLNPANALNQTFNALTMSAFLLASVRQSFNSKQEASEVSRVTVELFEKLQQKGGMAYFSSDVLGLLMKAGELSLGVLEENKSSLPKEEVVDVENMSSFLISQKSNTPIEFINNQFVRVSSITGKVRILKDSEIDG